MSYIAFQISMSLTISEDPMPSNDISVYQYACKFHCHVYWIINTAAYVCDIGLLELVPTKLTCLSGGRLKMLVTGLHITSLSLQDEAVKVNDDLTIPSRQEYQAKLKLIRNAFLNRVHVNRPWAYYLGLCEILNFVNVILQIYLTDKFLDGAFLDLGSEVAGGNFDGKVDVLDLVFPKVTKCVFHKYGPSGNIQKHDALCVMALNVVNEKIYTFLWFWLVILAIITGLSLVWRIITMLLHARSVTKFQF